MGIVVHGLRAESGEADFPSREDLADVLERVQEEIRMARLLMRQIELPDALAPHMVSALREALLVRVFRLRQFYYGSAEEESEVVADDYFADPAEWIAARPPAPPHLSRWIDDLRVWIEERISKEAESRVPGDAWPLESVVEALVHTHELFCDAIVEHHGDSFEDNPAMTSRS